MRPREINNVSFFINWINKEKNLDFFIDRSFKEEDSHIDVIIQSEKLKQKLFIQNVAYRYGTMHRTAISNIPESNLIFIIGGVNSDKEKKESIIKCIKEKEGKYPISLVKDLILIIEITIPSIKPSKLKKFFPKTIESCFKGIYFVSLPVTLPEKNDKYGQSGFIYPLKEI